jgi:hypothetical protein
MGVWDKLRNVGNYVRKGWRSVPDSYDQCRRGVSASVSKQNRGARTKSAMVSRSARR